MFLLLILTGCTQGGMEPLETTSNTVIGTTISNEEGLVNAIIEGSWLVSEYVESALLLDLNPLPEGYNDHVEDNINEITNSVILFNEDTVTKVFPPSEMGFFYETTNDLYFGYKVQLDLEAPIIYASVEHVEFNNPISFIKDGAGNTYIEIDYNFYKINPLSATSLSEENTGQTELSNLQKLIDTKNRFKPSNEVPASQFIDMDYLFLVRENPGIFTDGCMPWYEYALLGSSYDTYEKGINCYNDVNLYFEEWQIGRAYESAKEQYREEVVNQYFRSHIIAFSPDGESVLLKTYINFIAGYLAFYEISGSPYIYQEIISPDMINYTKGLQFVTLETPVMFDENYTFYEIHSLYNYDAIQHTKPYDISVTTDSNDTLYYKKDVNSQGEKCISIYSIADNDLIFQSEGVREYPFMVEILDHRLIAGFESISGISVARDYFEINMGTNESKYLFSLSKEGEFSPDGKYFAFPTSKNGYRGYSIYSLETDELTFIKSYLDDEVGNFQSKNYVYCWVEKDKVEERKELAKK